MGTVLMRRAARRDAPQIPSGEVILDSPPEIPTAAKAWTQLLMTLPMLAGAGAMALMYSQNGGGPMTYVMGGMFGMSSVGMVAMGFMNVSGGQGKREMITARRGYMRHLSLHRRKIRRTADQQREAMYYRHPDPDELWVTAGSYRLWERRANDADFGVVRIGIGPQAIATPLITPQTKPLDELEPLSAGALRQFVRTYSTIDDLPIAMAMNGFSRVYLEGNAPAGRAMIRALMAQLSVHHSPDDLRIALCCGPEERELWEWAKWMPHCCHPERTDALGPVRLVAQTVPAIEAMMDDLLATRPRFNLAGPGLDVPGPHLVVVIDNGDIAGSSDLTVDSGVEGVTVIDLHNPAPRLLDSATLVLDVAPDRVLTSRTKDSTNHIGRADALSIEQSEALARQLAPMRISIAASGDQAMSTSMDLADLLSLGDPFAFSVSDHWKPRANRNQLRVPIGIGPDGQPIDLDLKESAQDGMGPHGLLIGATGSGKSELLRTLVLALATTHNSETLNFVLVDFKGGATFTKLDRLPHTSAVITNLSDELPLVDRMTDAINGELLRRQELLRSAGNFSSLRDYEKARLAGAPLAPMPSLLIICDEFSELLSAKPDFIDMFVQIGRVGRSLGVHLLLASQRLEEGRLRGLDTHLSYRISLRTNSAMESRVVINSPDAFELPRAPGHGFMKFGTEDLVRFRAAYVSGVYHRNGRGAMAANAASDVQILPYNTSYVAPQVTEEKPEESVPDSDEGIGESLLDVLVERIEDKGAPAHRVWLPPLAQSPTLDQMLPSLSADPERGLMISNRDAWGALRPSIGLIDRPLEQRRDTLSLDLAGGDGHVLVVGGPQSGKSNTLRTIISSLALSHTAQEVQFYCFDFGGGALGTVRDLPHVGTVSSRSQDNQIRRTLAELSTLLDERETRFAENGVDGMTSYRRRKRAGDFTDDPYGDVFLIVDGWLTLRNDFDELDTEVADLATRGLAYGIHVVVAASRWMDLRSNVRDLFGTKIELKLGDPSDSEFDRRAAYNVPAGAPGRGITAERLHMLIGLPRIDSVQTSDDLAEGVSAFVRTVNDAWQGPVAPTVRLLPTFVDYETEPVDRSRGLAIGIAEQDLGPVYIDPRADPHFIIFGDAESGKSSLLRTIGMRVVEQFTDKQACLCIVDYRRSMLGVFNTEHMLGYLTTAAQTEQMMIDVAEVMAARLPGPDVTPEQLRNRSWWSGADLYVLIDDYDLVIGGMNNPLEPLLPYLTQARDVGLHVIIARRSGGASRAMYEAFLMRLRELASPGIVLSGDRDEGALIGNARPEFMPPGRGRLVTRREGTRLVQLLYPNADRIMEDPVLADVSNSTDAPSLVSGT